MLQTENYSGVSHAKQTQITAHTTTPLRGVLPVIIATMLKCKGYRCTEVQVGVREKNHLKGTRALIFTA